MSAFLEQQKELGFAVELICTTIGVSRSAHYARRGAAPSARALRDAELVETIRRVHGENFSAYGYRKMHLALRREGICDVGRDCVQAGLSDEVCVVVVSDLGLCAGPPETGAPKGRAALATRRAAREGTHHHEHHEVRAAPAEGRRERRAAA